VEHAGDERADLGCARDVERRGRERARRGAPRVCGERQLSREHPEEDDAEREDVGPLVLGRAAPLLRRHVRRRAAADAPVPERVGQPEVEHLDDAAVAQEDVPGLEIAVHDALRVRVRDGGRDGHRDRKRLPERERPRREPVGERLATEQLEDEERPLGRAPDLAERDDVRVGEPGGDLRLPEEPLLANGLGAARTHGLERDDPSAPVVVRLPHDAESAAADLPDEGVVADRRAGAEPPVPRAPELGRGRARQLGEESRQAARRDAALRVRHGCPESGVKA
jgi:hypothetical protein